MGYVFFRKVPDAAAELPFWNRHDFVHHQPAWRAEAVAFVRLHKWADESGISRIRRKSAECDRIQTSKTIVLKN